MFDAAAACYLERLDAAVDVALARPTAHAALATLLRDAVRARDGAGREALLAAAEQAIAALPGD